MESVWLLWFEQQLFCGTERPKAEALGYLEAKATTAAFGSKSSRRWNRRFSVG